MVFSVLKSISEVKAKICIDKHFLGCRGREVLFSEIETKQKGIKSLLAAARILHCIPRTELLKKQLRKTWKKIHQLYLFPEVR